MLYISLGSNIGHRMHNLQRALTLLEERYLKNMVCSIILETECLLPERAPESWNKPFLNMVVAGESDLSPPHLLQGLKQIEHELGRPCVYEKWAPRVIDLDILLWEGVSLETPSLTIPHAELPNRPFLRHLLAMMGVYAWRENPPLPESFLKSFVAFPRFVGIVNVTPDSFSDGGLYDAPDQAVHQVLKLASEGASVIEIGAQSTRPGALIHGPEAEYAKLKPVLEALKPFMASGELTISVDTFWPAVIHQILDHYPISWLNDVKGDLDDETIRRIAQRSCRLVIMHSLSVPPQKDVILPWDRSPVPLIVDWAHRTMERLTRLGLPQDAIIIDPGIGFGKSCYQNIDILHHLDDLRTLDVSILMGHSRKGYAQAFSKAEPKNRDLETIAASAFLAPKADFLRVHNIADHMRFFVAQQALNGRP